MVEHGYFFTSDEHDLLARLSHPETVQEYLDGLTYDFDAADSQTRDVRSFRRVVKDQQAICFDAAFTAVTALQYHEYDPFFLKFLLRSPERYLAHVVAIYSDGTKLGSVGFSRRESLKGKPPSFRTPSQILKDYKKSAFEEGYYTMNWSTVHPSFLPTLDWKFSDENLSIKGIDDDFEKLSKKTTKHTFRGRIDDLQHSSLMNYANSCLEFK